MSELQERNVKAMIEYTEITNEKIEAMAKQISGLNRAVGDLTRQLNEMKQERILERLDGGGPTVR